MRSRLLIGLVAAVTLHLGVSAPAAADITVTGKYVLVSGDTVTRATYFSLRRTRVTAPDGREFIYDGASRQITVIDHAQRIYWSGPLELADSLAGKLLLQRREELKPLIEANRERWAEMMSTFNDSIRVGKTDDSREIAGYLCSRTVMVAGSHMTHERWVTRGLTVNNYGPELEKVVMASILDPLGRVLMKMLIQLREQSGLVLASRTSFRTLTQSGTFSWEASEVKTGGIPPSVWHAPQGYRRIQL